MLGWSFWFVLNARQGSLCLLREFDGREFPLHNQEFRRDFPNFSERFKGCCSLALGELRVCQAEPRQFISRIELEFQVKLCFGVFQFLRMQIGLA